MSHKNDEKRLRNHGLDFESMSDYELWAANVTDIKNMDLYTTGSGLYSLGNLLSGNSDISFVIDLMKAQMRQQWIIVRQNEQIIRLLRESLGKDPRRQKSGEADIQIEDEPEMRVIRRIPAKPTSSSQDYIGAAVSVDGNNVTVGNICVAVVNARFLDIINNALRSGCKVVLAEVDGNSAVLDVMTH